MKKKIIIIGGGIAGLCAGVYARLAGFDAEIYEKNPIVGGQCMGWDRAGFHIDNCIHWLTGTRKDTEMYRVWKTVGALSDDTEYADVTEFFTCINGGQSATLWNDLERTRKELLALAPEDKAEIEKFMEHVEYAKDCLFPAGKPMDMMGVRDYIEMGKRMADMPKVMKEYGNISLEELGGRFKNPVLKQMMGDYMPKEYAAYSFLVSYATMASENGKIPLGGSLAMSQRIREKFLGLGGKIHSLKDVKSIIIEKNKAKGIMLADGSEALGDYVISAVDFDALFGKMLDKKYIPQNVQHAYEDAEGFPVISGFQVAFSVEERLSQKGIALFDCEPYQVAGKTYDKLSVKVYDYDEIYRRNGKIVLQCNLNQNHEDYYFWKGLSKEEYAARKREYALLMKSRIEKKYPETVGNIEILDVWTPLTYERYCGAYHGAYMSFVTVPGKKSVKTKGTLKGLKNFYLAGQWTMAPGGLPVAAASGKFAIQRILKKEHRSIDLE